MRALVTGAAGFVGAHLLRLLRARGHDAHAMTLPHEHLPEDLSDVPRHPGDVTDPATLETVLRDVAPEWIFHLAAISRPADCRAKAALAWEVNFLGTCRLYGLVAERFPKARFLFIGSAAEYDPALGRKDMPLTEDARLVARDVYSGTKLAADLVGGEFARSGRLAVIRVRPFNHIGPGQESGFVAADFARQIARIERGLQEPKMEVGNLAPVRDFTDVRDVVRAYALLLEKGEPGAVYNVCSGTGRSIRELLDGLLKLSTAAIEVIVSERRKRKDEADVIVGSARAIRAVCGWTPEIPWETTLSDILDDWRRRVAAEGSRQGA